MKKIIFSLFIATVGFSVKAQIKTPQPSTFQKIEQAVGLSNITLEYSRPNMNGRAIFGNLVPFGEIWRTGANANTKITFSTDVTIDGKSLKKGTYAIFTKPNKNAWEVIFYSDATNWGTPRTWDETKVALQTSVNVQEMPMNIETFTMTFDDITNNSAVIGILWEKANVEIKFETPTDVMVSQQIKTIMAGPSADDFFASAVYYLQANKDIKQAQKWIDKAVEMTSEKPRYWFLRQQSLIHAKAGNKKGAIAAAKASLKYAEEGKNADYIKMNKDSLKEWGAM
ncbi:MAG: DUF2911 domain-containing protein [Flavobacteriia bacterium]|nr:DUF2911 domain-containing protein [Flavobacteriia bacterium]OIP47216.1 MAG: dihydrolipoamide dehydrogenase [Flavobacteriaceae bacterium CG2_30_31_66]PIV96019.1 MAG: dihydrolipoamide dehydrogenase [Flavobacteriaceae bacterium CG17_big_fil_post_rev_8_21_14_2_50_31_13]PIY13931.1 MAG: dihydrolipoamide dehydrogenase [Flavobacteriaceae bacterium CG_4_10_14_3_um_filter_31_253]PIZ10973.1 MAG: dihydrolipoamide dehydrogenase [Flavobacteriaceae bacterium CG_4_10_14_0_8_um_filter_31_99]PJC10950.1 MAG: 